MITRAALLLMSKAEISCEEVSLAEAKGNCLDDDPVADVEVDWLE